MFSKSAGVVSVMGLGEMAVARACLARVCRELSFLGSTSMAKTRASLLESAQRCRALPPAPEQASMMRSPGLGSNSGEMNWEDGSWISMRPSRRRDLGNIFPTGRARASG